MLWPHGLLRLQRPTNFDFSNYAGPLRLQSLAELHSKAMLWPHTTCAHTLRLQRWTSVYIFQHLFWLATIRISEDAKGYKNKSQHFHFRRSHASRNWRSSNVILWPSCFIMFPPSHLLSPYRTGVSLHVCLWPWLLFKAACKRSAFGIRLQVHRHASGLLSNFCNSCARFSLVALQFRQRMVCFLCLWFL